MTLCPNIILLQLPPLPASLTKILKGVIQNAFFHSQSPWKLPRTYVKVTQSCLTLCNPMEPPGSSVHGILQARTLEWVAIPFPRGSSRPRDWTWVSHIFRRFFTVWATKHLGGFMNCHSLLELCSVPPWNPEKKWGYRNVTWLCQTTNTTLF